MMTADEAKKITHEAIEEQKDEAKRILEIFLVEAEDAIKESANKGQTICYVNIPEALQYNEYKAIDVLREYGYGAQFDCYDMMKITW